MLAIPLAITVRSVLESSHAAWLKISRLSTASGTQIAPYPNDSIWAAGRVCYRQDDSMASGLGVRFVAMARSQARMIRDFCIEMRRSHLGSLLARIRAN